MKNIFLFTGIERYLINKKVNEIKSKIKYPEMNLHIFNEDNINNNDFINACEQIPFMTDKSLVYVEFDCFKSNSIIEYIKAGVPDSTILTIVSSSIDKRTKMYKFIKKNGKVIVFNKLNENQLLKFIKESKAHMDQETMKYFINRTGYLVNSNITLYDIVGNIAKLTNYTNNITIDVVKKLVLKSPEENVFNLTNLISNNQIAEALAYAEGLLQMGNNAIGLIGLIKRHFRILLKIKYLSNPQNIGLNSFVISKMSNQSQKFTDDKLIKILVECNKYTQLIKQGKVKDTDALEMLIMNWN